MKSLKKLGPVLVGAIVLSPFTSALAQKLTGPPTFLPSGLAITSPKITGEMSTAIATLALRDTSAAFDLTIAATSSTALTAGRTLTIDMKNVAHTLVLNATANTITFPNTASYTLIGSGDIGTVSATMLVGTDITTVGALTSGSIASGFGAIATANTISTTNATATSSPTTGALTVTGGVGVGGSLWVGATVVSQGSTGGFQANSRNGAGNNYVLYTPNGGTGMAIFNGTSNTYTFADTLLSAPNISVSSSTSPTNGVYLPAASTVGLVGATKYELFAGASVIEDYNVTTASTVTVGAATTINNATFKVTTLAASTAIDTVCYTTATGLFTEEPTGTTCTVSDERKKTAMKPISRRHSLDIVLGAKPISYFYKSEMGDPDYHLGFGAQTLAKVAPELVQRDQDGVPNAVKQLELLPITWAAMQQQQQQLNAQGLQIAELKQVLGLRK